MWKIEQTDSKKYPYSIQLKYRDKLDLTIYSNSKWPEQDQSVFCVKAETKGDINIIKTVEEAEISSIRWLEDKTKVSVTLDRKVNKKCEFRFVKKSYKNKPGEYEQIFFRSKQDENPISLWKVTKTDSKKFPYHITVSENNKTSLSLLTQDKWPGASGNIFCIRAEDSDISLEEVVEEVPVVFVKKLGKRLTILLDRGQRKRCEFLFIRKKYKTKDGDYEQIFFRTQQGINQHRTRGNLSLQPKSKELEVIIDSNERYPWKFGEHNIQRKNLSVGDYALLIDNDMSAVVERKTFDNMVSDISRIQVLHQQLNELSTYNHSAVVIEAQYGDFLSSEKIGKYSSVANMARALAEITVVHPNLPIIYAGNRKEANHWSLRFFEGVLKKQIGETNNLIATVAAKTRNTKADPLWLRVKKVILEEMPNEFIFTDIKSHFTTLSDGQVRTQLSQLKKQEVIQNEGRGKASKWIKLQNRFKD
ncbi:ERCC4 domain-containing protein [Francisella sp. 19X1-34]|uniref:ERCC4 domain-containing protein n=1 Tax=Francisella sp. 19X1-34 TaxID=3087177 RepID=UPI002E3567A3|nr:ERCC4 domain-containing protein [Francisella sp. 19X1-34]MED7789271.1 ERCC4 domain-containing protein [Francisella sp. 19X1-34]